MRWAAFNSCLVRLWLIIIIAQCQAVCLEAREQPEQLALDRYARLVDQAVSDAQATTILERYDDGSWTDIDYHHKARTGWKTMAHLNRCVQLARICHAQASAESIIAREDAVRMLNRALSYWKERDFRNPNWFQNDIGVPGRLRDVLALAEDALDSELRAWALNRLGEAKNGNKSGTNLIWLADLKLHLGLFRRDRALIAETMALIAGAIHVGEGPGIQEDYSFLFHKQRLQMYSYGRAFLEITTRLAWQMRDTPWGIDDDVLMVLRNFALEGYQWMARGCFSVPATMDRASSRKGGLTRPRAITTFELLTELDPEYGPEYRTIIRAQRDVSQFKLEGVRHFPKADLLVKHGKQGSFFVKWISDRTLPTESINNENLRGKWLNAGNTFIVRDGTEYTDLMPFWDWDLLPGFTWMHGAAGMTRKPFSGALAHDGHAVAHTAVELLDGNKQPVLSANKAWFLHGNTLIGLVGNIKRPDGEPVLTALDQSRWQGGTMITGRQQELGAGTHRLDGETWILHHGLAYYSSGKNQFMELRQEEVTAHWESVNLRYSGGASVRDRVFHPLVITGGDAQEFAVQILDEHGGPPEKCWELVRNDSVAQMVILFDGTIMGVLHAANKPVQIGTMTLTANVATLFLIKNGTLKASQLR